MSPRTAAAVQAGDAPKGEVLPPRVWRASRRPAGRPADPPGAPISPTFIDVSATVEAEAGFVELISEVRVVDRTGVEMEAMTACAVAALTVYDMVKGLERGMAIEQIVLLEKAGGRSDWRRPQED